MFTWHAIPFARLLIPFSAGIITACYLSPAFLLSAAVMAGALLILCVPIFMRKDSFSYFRYSWLHGISISLIMLCLGACRTWGIDEQRQPGHFTAVPEARVFSVYVSEPFTVKPNVCRSTVSVLAVCDSAGKWQRCRGKLLLYLKRDSLAQLPHCGDTLLLHGNCKEIDAPVIAEGFDFKTYMARQQVYRQIFCRSGQYLCRPLSGFSLSRIAEQIRQNTIDILSGSMGNSSEKAVAEALLLGYKDDLDPDIVSAFAHTGTLHVLAVSGMHAGIIYMVLMFLTGFLARSKKGRILQTVVILLCLWCYIMVTGFSASMLRAGYMCTLMALGRLLMRQSNTFNIVYASAFLLLVINPFYLADVGFQLSYAAVLGIVYIQPAIAGWYAAPSRLMKLVWDMFSVSLAAQLLTFPLSLYYFHQFPNIFILSNLVVIPLTTAALFVAMALLLLHGISVLQRWLARLLEWLLGLNNDIICAMEQWKYSYTDGLYITLPETAALSAAVLCVVSYMMHRRKWQFMTGLTAMLVFMILVNIRSFDNARRSEAAVHRFRNNLAATCIKGHTAYLMADSTFFAHWQKNGKYLQPYYDARGVENVVFLPFIADDRRN